MDADGYERLSKREQATRDFVEKVQNRTATALVNYFLSHGVHVLAEDLGDAVTLEDHQAFLNSLSHKFEATTSAIRLAVDIGSISLAEKEKAMRAVYQIEKLCAENHGSQGELGEAASALLSAVRSYPSAPSLTGAFIVGLLGAFLTYAISIGAGLGLTALALIYGATNATKYFRGRDAALTEIEAAEQRFDTLLTTEISPRPQLRAVGENVKIKAIGFASVTLVAMLVAASAHVSQPTQDAASDVTANESAPAATVTSHTFGDDANQTNSAFAWMVGKYPYNVVNDHRFKAAFRGVARADWKKIAERLTVVNQAGIESKDGFLVGEGCMAHECNSEKAAFAINETTGKGVLIMMHTPSNTPVFTTYQWKDAAIEQTPLANWKQQQLADSMQTTGTAPAPEGVTTTAVPPTFPTSFDCAKAHSDAEHLICGDAQLAEADIELAAGYAKAKAAVSDQTAFRERTRAQWNYREETCHDRECLARWYADQKIALNEMAATGRVGP